MTMINNPSTAVQATSTSGGLARVMIVVAGAAVTILWFAHLAHWPLYDPDEGRMHVGQQRETMRCSTNPQLLPS